MYPFQISPDDNSNLILVFGEISIITDGYRIERDKHYFDNPTKAIAYFNVKDEIYSISNRWGLYATAEDFYDAMKHQHNFFIMKRITKKGSSNNINPGNLSASA